MAAIDNISITNSDAEQLLTGRDVKDFIRGIFWAWFEANKNDVVFTVKIWIIKKDLTLDDLRIVFVRIFGAQPLNTFRA